MSTKSTLPPVVSPADLAECVAAYMEAHGLEKTQQHFEGMEHLISRLPCWAEVKSKVEGLFANERKRLEKLELERAKAAAPNIYQVLPAATAGVSMTDTHFAGSMYEIKENDNVNLGDNSNG